MLEEEEKVGFERKVYEEDENCDVSFEVEGRIFRAHKEVLGKNCKYFDNMFRSIWRVIGKRIINF